MALLGRVDVEQLARELKIVLDVGLRAPKLRGQLGRLPNLINLTGINVSATSDWGIAAGIAQLLADAIEGLGDGPYGSAVSDLFGTHAATRGLPKARRRASAADVLETEVATFVRHWERDMLLDLAVAIALRR